MIFVKYLKKWSLRLFLLFYWRKISKLVNGKEERWSKSNDLKHYEPPSSRRHFSCSTSPWLAATMIFNEWVGSNIEAEDNKRGISWLLLHTFWKQKEDWKFIWNFPKVFSQVHYTFFFVSSCSERKEETVDESSTRSFSSGLLEVLLVFVFVVSFFSDRFSEDSCRRLLKMFKCPHLEQENAIKQKSTININLFLKSFRNSENLRISSFSWAMTRPLSVLHFAQIRTKLWLGESPTRKEMSLSMRDFFSKKVNRLWFKIIFFVTVVEIRTNLKFWDTFWVMLLLLLLLWYVTCRWR